MNLKLPPLFEDREGRERDYFLSIAQKHEKELLLHRDAGKLWHKDNSGKDWSNVTEHCLLEAARVSKFAKILNISDPVRSDLVSAAVVHDFNKKSEIFLTRKDIEKGGTGRKGLLIAEEESEKNLRVAGFSETVISLAGCVAAEPKNLFQMKDFLYSSALSSLEMAHIVMHYVDNYTRYNLWAEIMKREKGRNINDVDRRNAMNASNPAYKKMNKEGLAFHKAHPFFRGMTRFEAAIAINHLIENKLFEIMKKQSNLKIKDPLEIPEFIDNRIKEHFK